jgi:hypothetical protein
MSVFPSAGLIRTPYSLPHIADVNRPSSLHRHSEVPGTANSVAAITAVDLVRFIRVDRWWLRVGKGWHGPTQARLVSGRYMKRLLGG